ncbi:uncharacterized protein [Palaemon carinicauda]|uniref:uncharacterized protein n=1 Tax=Palaemon carinicauda TaxID=392227 RepID=UPI0035B5CB27
MTSTALLLPLGHLLHRGVLPRASQMLQVSEVLSPKEPLHRPGDLHNRQGVDRHYILHPRQQRRTYQPPTNHAPPPTNRISRQNPNPSRHAIPEFPSPPSLPPARKPQHPPRLPPKSKRSPSHTPFMPSPVGFTSPPTPSTASQQIRPKPS